MEESQCQNWVHMVWAAESARVAFLSNNKQTTPSKLLSANILSILEPPDLSRTDGKCPDGLTCHGTRATASHGTSPALTQSLLATSSNLPLRLLRVLRTIWKIYQLTRWCPLPAHCCGDPGSLGVPCLYHHPKRKEEMWRPRCLGFLYKYIHNNKDCHTMACSF